MVVSPMRVAFYSPADLNLLDGSAIWVQAVAEVLSCGPEVEITLPLRSPERRDVTTRLLRNLNRVELVSPLATGRGDPWGLQTGEVLDLIERLDQRQPFDAILLRSYRVCREAADRPGLRDRLWSTYIIEPELDLRSDEYLDGLAAIAASSRYLVVQSEEMRALLEATVPGAEGKTILLPPAIPSASPRADPAAVFHRLVYAGKFSPLYPVSRFVDMFTELRRTYPDLEFHVAGDKFHYLEGGPGWMQRLQRGLTQEPGVTWHRGIGRGEVAQLLSVGGVGLNVWDSRHDLPMNNLVLSTKTLDYCAAGLPVLLNRTASHEAMLGRDYPLFASGLDDAPLLLDRVLADPELYRAAAERTWEAARPFTYPEVYRRLEPFLQSVAGDSGASTAAEGQLMDRPKLLEASLNLGVVDPDAVESAIDILQRVRAADDRVRLIVLGSLEDRLRQRMAGTGVADAVTIEPSPAGGLASWLRKIGFLVATDGATNLVPVLASGTIPVVVASAPTAAIHRQTGVQVYGSPKEAAEEISQVIATGKWTERSAVVRDAARRAQTH